MNLSKEIVLKFSYKKECFDVLIYRLMKMCVINLCCADDLSLVTPILPRIC